MATKKTTKKVVKTKKLSKAINDQLDRHYEDQGYKGWDEVDIPPVKDWSRFKPQGEVNEETINYWKYALISILLGIVVAMIISTPHVIKALEACTN